MTAEAGFVSRRTFIAGAMRAGIVLSSGFARSVEVQAEDRGVPGSKAAEVSAPARPWVYWFWFNGNISREGITADLEAMHAIGIGGAIVMCSGLLSPGPVRYLSPLWMELNQHMLREAARLGMQIDLNNDDGWSDAAGPWMPPELAMHKITWSEMIVDGGHTMEVSLPPPPSVGGFYRDTAVLAFPAPLGAGMQMPEPEVHEQPGDPSYIVHDYRSAVATRSAEVNLWAGPEIGSVPVIFKIEASDDGQDWRSVYRFDNAWRWTAQRVSRSLTLSVRFAATQARYYRVLIPYTTKLGGSNPETQSNAFRLFAEDRMSLWELKAGFGLTTRALEQPDRYPAGFLDEYLERGTPPGDADPDSAIDPHTILELTANAQEGTLRWQAPKGRWLVQRVGYTLTGWKNHTASEEGLGLNANMFVPEAMDLQFAAVLDKVFEANPHALPRTLSTVHMDSSECGAQNWSVNLPGEFERRCGYKLTPWLPAVAGGRIVGSLEQTERFLWDLRRTMADLIAENYWGRFAVLAHRHGLQFTAEASGRMQFLNDPLLYLSKADIPMGEFWVGEKFLRPDCGHCRSTANAYGRAVVMAEAYTSFTPVISENAGRWQEHPYSLKALGDKALCAGINHFVFHRYLAQPQLDDFPGFAWGNKDQSIGINMERTNTWWRPAKAWIQYISRCQAMLQRGREVVDVCVLMDEGVPNHLVEPEGLPSGFHFDGLHAEILSKMVVDRGELVLPSGMRYRILLLPATAKMRPATALEVARLSKAGAVVAGPRPTASPSLARYPACDKELAEAVAAWRPLPTLAEAIHASALRPDFRCEAQVLFQHRRDGDEDFYFLSNQEDREIRFEARFRIIGRAPELFDPDSGLTVGAAVYETLGGETRLPLTLDPSGSMFVVFRKRELESVLPVEGVGNTFDQELLGAVIHSVEHGTEVIAARAGPLVLRSSRGRKASIDVPRSYAAEIPGPWSLHFPTGWGAPPVIELPTLISWSEHSHNDVRHFSGTATYHGTFDVPAAALKTHAIALLDLGQVQVIAEVTLNGVALGTRWRPPFCFDVSSELRPGRNSVQIAVTNLWPNRLIGDAALSPQQRYTRTNFNPYLPGAPLMSSGMMGPVMLRFAHREFIRWQ